VIGSYFNFIRFFRCSMLAVNKWLYLLRNGYFCECIFFNLCRCIQLLLCHIATHWFIVTQEYELSWYFYWFIDLFPRFCHIASKELSSNTLKIIFILYRSFLIVFWKVSKSPQPGIRVSFVMMEGKWHLMFIRGFFYFSLLLVCLLETKNPTLIYT
jgi:hypothetical protein